MQVLDPSDVAAFVRDVLLNPARTRPVVAITTQPRTGHTWIDPRELELALGDLAEVVCLETGDATWELADALPARLDAYGGAIRIWWPGLVLESDPYEHRLYFVHSQAEAREVFERLVEDVRKRADGGPEPAATPGVVETRVTRVEEALVELESEELEGPLRHADVPLPELARCLEPGMTLPARPVKDLAGGRAEFSVAGLLEKPWDRALAELSAGDVLVGRVQNSKDFGVFVDVLPGVTGLVHISEIDWGFVEDPRRVAKPGQLVPVKILTLDSNERRMELSIKRAFGTDARPSPSLVKGGRAFAWNPADEPLGASRLERGESVRELSDEVEELAGDRARLAGENRELRERGQKLSKDLRSYQDRYEALKRRDGDPLTNGRAFLQGVRVNYARMFDESDRHAHPLLPMQVGPRFLDSLRALEGAEIEKVLEVCAQVASETAHELPARAVHQLRDGRGGQSRVRPGDDAQAWRCALQVNTPSARRLHWWRVPGPEGATIEFASVGVHDDFDIPE